MPCPPRTPPRRSPSGAAPRARPEARTAPLPPPQRTTARALLALARLVQARLELAGRLTDAGPDAMLDVVERWCEGAATDAEVRTARWIAGHAPPECVDLAMRDLGGLASDLAECVGGGPNAQRERSARGVVDGAERCLCRLGETPEVARELVVTVFALFRRRPSGRPPSTP